MSQVAARVACGTGGYAGSRDRTLCSLPHGSVRQSAAVPCSMAETFFTEQLQSGAAEELHAKQTQPHAATPEYSTAELGTLSLLRAR